MYENWVPMLKLVRDQLPPAVLDVHADSVAQLGDPAVWLAPDRTVMRRGLEAVLFGVADLQGLPRMALPASWVAAAIAVYVHPVNWQSACHLLSVYVTTDYEQQGGSIEVVSAGELFRLTTQLAAGNPVEVAKANEAMKARLALVAKVV